MISCHFQEDSVEFQHFPPNSLEMKPWHVYGRVPGSNASMSSWPTSPQDLLLLSKTCLCYKTHDLPYSKASSAPPHNPGSSHYNAVPGSVAVHDALRDLRKN